MGGYLRIYRRKWVDRGVIYSSSAEGGQEGGGGEKKICRDSKTDPSVGKSRISPKQGLELFYEEGGVQISEKRRFLERECLGGAGKKERKGAFFL